MSATPIVTVAIPAHNEAAGIADALNSLARQTRRPDLVYVVCDNCTDATPDIVRSLIDELPFRTELFFTQGNTLKKAGALNQFLSRMLLCVEPEDYLLVMDADTQLDDVWIEVAVRTLTKRPEVGAVGAVFYGEERAGLLEQLQRNEYVRYARDIDRKNGRAMVLTGTGTLFRVPALTELREARNVRIPGKYGDIYDTAALTEDNEITLALKTLGWKCVSPKECRVVTELMPTWRELWHQRLRWQRGALENLKAYGPTKVTLPYFFQQFMLGLGAFALGLYLLAMVASVFMGMEITLQPFWAGVGLVFLIERVITVRKAGLLGISIAAVLLIEMVFDGFLMAVYVKSVMDIVTRREANWHHGATTPVEA
jgi:cellulose synthase/poly-beta-1,6-N-acetylglucosamine synthase-like glycosyltransferase